MYKILQHAKDGIKKAIATLDWFDFISDVKPFEPTTLQLVEVDIQDFDVVIWNFVLHYSNV
jgi:hypothetical protein